MKLHHFFYTKLANKEDSPWGHVDWHFVYYPLQVLGDISRQEILKRLHYAQKQTLPDFNDKVSYFPLEINGERYQVILYFLRKPDALDYAGRGDCFLCHGFIVPSNLQVNVPSPLALFEIIRPFLFLSREQASDSPLVDQKSGDLQPIELDDELLSALASRPVALQNEFEARLALLFRHGGGTKEGLPPVLFQGESASVITAADRVYPFVQKSMRSFLCCEPAFDGGNWFFFPLKTVGFSVSKPGGGDPVAVSLDNMLIEPPGEYVDLLEPINSFERWMLTLRGETFTMSGINFLEALSLMLESGNLSPMINVTSIPDSFVQHHQTNISGLFERTITGQYGAPLSKLLFGNLNNTEKLSHLLNPPPASDFGNHISNLILGFRIPFSSLPSDLLSNLARVNPFLNLLVNILKNNASLTSEDFLALPENMRTDFLHLILVNGACECPWLIGLLVEDRERFELLLKQADCRPIIANAVQKALNGHKHWGGVADILLPNTTADDYHDILAGDPDLWNCLEKILCHEGKLPEADLTKLVSWARGRMAADQAGRYTKAFLFPRHFNDVVKSFPPRIAQPAAGQPEDRCMNSTDNTGTAAHAEPMSASAGESLTLDHTTTRLFFCLKDLHGFSEAELDKVGYCNRLIQACTEQKLNKSSRNSGPAEPAKGGLFSFIKKLFMIV